jgi:geranylgeranyl pyrophosphate synthase
LNGRLNAFINRHGAQIEDALRAHLPYSSQAGARRLNEALDYALFPGGKRLRPLLALAAARLAGATDAQGITIGCAVEFLHSSSLILDDLPAMDDAHLRRNRRALHLVYGEGLAVLAAVALLNQAYALLTRAAVMDGASHATALAPALLAEAARAVGADGMIGGQAVDLELQAAGASARALASRDLKTVALMRLMMLGGARACGADDETAGALSAFGERFGRVYQICDDLLDTTCDAALSGKNAGQDARHLRPSAVSVLGRSASQNLAASLVAEGATLLSEKFGAREETHLLIEAAETLLDKVKAAGVEQLPHANAERLPVADAEHISVRDAEQRSVLDVEQLSVA